MCYRWNKQKGDIVGLRYNEWYTNEPDLNDFDYSTRKHSPLTHLAMTSCGNNPTFGCSTGGASYNCSNLMQSVATIGSNVQISCATTGSGTRDNARCGVPRDTIFVDLAKIKEETGESKAACMALLGPDIDSTLQTQDMACATVSGGTCSSDEYNPCQVLFNIVDDSQLNLGYKKFMDLNCASKTNSLMCEMIGKKKNARHQMINIYAIDMIDLFS